MWIEIAARYRPFSHLPGARCLLPGSDLVIQAFPALLRLGEREIPLEVEGPVQGFTLMQELERGEVLVFGKTPQGPLRYRVKQEDEGVRVDFEKFPHQREALVLSYSTPNSTPTKERLSLGMHKAQDVELLRRRNDLKEILPLLFALSQWAPAAASTRRQGGVFLLVDRCVEQSALRERTAIGSTLRALFQAGFSSLLVPRLIDDDHQGLVPPGSPPEAGALPLQLLRATGEAIRSLFFQEEAELWRLLPFLPVELHAGRLTALKTAAGDTIDLEWSKKLLRRVEIRPGSCRTVTLALQKGIASFRVRTSLKESGYLHSARDPLSLVPGSSLFLDRFS